MDIQINSSTHWLQLTKNQALSSHNNLPLTDKIEAVSKWLEKANQILTSPTKNRECTTTYFTHHTFSKLSCVIDPLLEPLAPPADATSPKTSKSSNTKPFVTDALSREKATLQKLFLIHKTLITNRYKELIEGLDQPPLVCPNLLKRIEKGYEGLKRKDLIEKISSFVLSKRYSTPASVAQDACAFAMIEVPKTDLTIIHNLSISTRSIALGVVLPVGFLNAFQLFRNRKYRIHLKKMLVESQDLQKIGNSMHQEGRYLRKVSRFHQMPNDDKHSTEYKFACTLMDKGIALKQSAKNAEIKLSRQLEDLNFSLINQAVSTPLEFASIASSCLSVASQSMCNRAIAGGLHVMHYIGIASGAIGLILGITSLVRKIQNLYTQYKKIHTLQEKSNRLIQFQNKYAKTKKIQKFCKDEMKKIHNELTSLHREKINGWIGVASSVVLLIASVLSMIAAFAASAASAGLSIAVTVIVYATTVISIGQYLEKKWYARANATLNISMKT